MKGPLLTVAAVITADTDFKPSTVSPDTLFIGGLAAPGSVQLTFSTPEAAELLANHLRLTAIKMREAEMSEVR